MSTHIDQQTAATHGNGTLHATRGEHRAAFLGYFSVGLGVAEFLAPGAMNRLIGVTRPDTRTVTAMRAMGLREMTHGIAILSSEDPERAVWSRVAGDALDLLLLGRTFANPANDRGRTLFATANVLAVAALDVVTARQLSRQGSRFIHNDTNSAPRER